MTFSAGEVMVSKLQPEWDAVVVGAGPAGAVMARQLARAGANVLLVDKASFPRAKPCGCCINSAVVAALDKIGLGDVPAQCDAVPIRRLDLRAAGLRSAAAELPLRGGVILSRSRFDQALVDAAVAAGAAFLDDTAARLIAGGDGQRAIQLQRSADVFTVRTRVVIAADGLAGTLLRDEPGFQPHVDPRSRIGAAVTLPEEASIDFGPGVIWMTCGQGGYVGSVRLETGELHLAAALDPAHVRESGCPGAAAASLLRRAQRTVPPGIVETHWRGTPTLMRRRRVEGDGVLVIGDAAGYVEPFTGEGMAWAVMSAIAAAPLAMEAVHGHRIRGQWSRRHVAMIGSRQRLCRAMAGMLRHPRLTARGVQLAGMVPSLSRPLLRALERPKALQRMGAGA